ncbi:MAG: DSBA oxidoreductase [Herpetosiphonaceae bacterium]|nr:MAG: DSBA oxidoreductase [Herpetosiphonaceae bacterium]
MPDIQIDIFADIACPWCYIGERRLERALALRPGLNVERRWRPFQLQPNLPRSGMPWHEFVQRKFGGLQRAQAMFNHVAAVGAAEGLTFAFDRMVSAPNTCDAQRLILFAEHQGCEWKAVDALFAAYFAQGRDLSRLDELVAIAAEIGLDAGQTRSYLMSDAGIAEVVESQEQAYVLGIQGVPFYIFDGRYAISGAQPVNVFLRALDSVYPSGEVAARAQ